MSLRFGLVFPRRALARFTTITSDICFELRQWDTNPQAGFIGWKRWPSLKSMTKRWPDIVPCKENIIIRSKRINNICISKNRFATLNGALWVRKFGYLYIQEIRCWPKSLRTYVHPRIESKAYTIRYLLILGNKHPCHGQLTAVQKGICWPVWRDYIAGSGT